MTVDYGDDDDNDDDNDEPMYCVREVIIGSYNQKL